MDHRKAALVLAVTVAACASTPAPSRSPAARAAEIGALAPAGLDAFTPVVLAPVGEIHPALGSDGRVHLVYELTLTNTTPLSWTIASLDARADGDAARVVVAYAGDAVAARTKLPAPGATLGPHQAGTFFVHASIPASARAPRSLVHRVAVASTEPLPEGFSALTGLRAGARDLAYGTTPVPVSTRAPVVLSPPLEGPGWVAGDGCCEATRHVRALLPIDGRPVVAQRFAIDWERVDPALRFRVGDPKDPRSFFGYGQRVLAVADGRVVKARDGLADQVPGKLPSSLPLADADGNHVVLDIGSGSFVLYAHLAPGTVAVREGDIVRRGQLLGRVGNTGNSSAPHLHLHVMNGVATLGSDGRPFAFDAYERRGQLPSTAAFDEAEASGAPVEIVEGAGALGRHERDMPMDLSVVDFPLRAPSP